MNDILTVLSNIFTLLFVVGSMIALGLSLTVAEIVEPLKDLGLVARALLVNFVLVPALAYAITALIPLDPAYRIGLIVLAAAPGAPVLPKLVQLAKGDVACGVGLMVLLMVTTVAYVPLVLPLLLPGVSVNPLDIASSLVVLMLIPLGISLLVKARYAELAASLLPHFTQASNIGLLGLLATMLLLNWRTLLSTVGSGAIITTLLFVAGSFALGYLLGPSAATRPTLGLGSAHRNVAAAMVVATGSFAAEPGVLIMVLVGAVLMMVTLLPAAGELGKRRQPAPAASPATNAA